MHGKLNVRIRVGDTALNAVCAVARIIGQGKTDLLKSFNQLILSRSIEFDVVLLYTICLIYNYFFIFLRSTIFVRVDLFD